MNEIQLSNASNSYIEKLKLQNPKNIQIPINDSQDEFQKNSNLEINNPNSVNTYQVAPKSNFNFKNKSNAIILLSSTMAIACVLGMFMSGKNASNLKRKNIDLEKINSNLQNTLNEQQKTVGKLNEQLNQTTQQLNKKNNEESQIIKKLNETIETLKTRLSSLCEDEGNVKALKEKRIKDYQAIADNAKLSYDPMLAPIKEVKSYCYIDKFFPFKDLSSTITSKKTNSYIDDLINKLKTLGEIKIPLVKKPNTPQAIEAASLKNTNDALMDIGVEKSAGFKLSYGERTNWKNQKISRDIMQNFYDANGHTLDGVGISIKDANGIYKVRIEGNGLYNCDSLLELGSGNKLNESPYNAGGFGEGSRIVVANLLAQKKTSNVKFASADWELNFFPKKESIVRKIEKSNQILDGNYIEFETKDKNFIESLIQSINYFNNSKNPDFQGLNFDSKDFGFKILPPNEKGNLYLTQRFEYGQEGNWDNELEGINLIFKRKPDFEQFKQITGKEFSTGRDRVYFNNNDIYDLTKYFANDLSDKDLINALLSTKQHWNSKSTKKETSAMTSFINALCDVCNSRSIGVDFKDNKICVYDGRTDANINNFIRDMGYTITPSHLNLTKIGLENTGAIFRKSSVHQALKPTEKEVKKLKLLEEATRTIQDSIQSSYFEKLKTIYNDCKNDLKTFINKEDAYYSFRHEIKDNFNDPFVTKYLSYWSNELPDSFLDDFLAFLDKKINQINPNDINKHSALANVLGEILSKNCDHNELYKQYSIQLKNLNLIAKDDVTKPRYIFDRQKELSKSTLGEAIIKNNFSNQEYEGHWIDKNFLDTGNFYDLLATWLHEICHKSGGDGTAEFTYKLTDLIEALAGSFVESPQMRADLGAIEEVFNKLQTT